MKALVIGYGSIGKRHCDILPLIGCPTAVVSARDIPVAGVAVFHSVEEALAADRFDYAVIANTTAEHFATIDRLFAAGFGGVILVEKPLFAKPEKSYPSWERDRIFTGYNLRFHPALAALKEALGGGLVFSATLYVGQYLPNWRPERDYRTLYSASRKMGGGVLRDLSHELDYALWLFGGWRALAALGGHFSDLATDADDAFTVVGETERCRLLTIHINCLDRIPHREIVVNTAAGTVTLDLLTGELATPSGITRFPVGRNDTYQAMHEAVISGPHAALCGFDEGLAVVEMIDAIERAAEEKIWVRK